MTRRSSVSSNWHDKNFEIRRPRDPGHKRKWRVSNKATGDAYDHHSRRRRRGVATKMPGLAFPARRRVDPALFGRARRSTTAPWPSGRPTKLEARQLVSMAKRSTVRTL